LPSDPATRLLRTTWLAALGGCVITKYGAPTAASALSIAAAIAMVPIAFLLAPERDGAEARPRLARTAVAGIGAALAAAAVAWSQGALRPLQTPWLTLFGIPFAFAAADFDGPALPRRRGAAFFWCASLAVGVAASQVWNTPVGALLLALAAAAAVADAAWSTARAARLKGVAPPSWSTRRALLVAAIVALASVAASIASYQLLQRVPRLHSRPDPPAAPAEDRLARQTGGAPRLDPDRTLALVHAADEGPATAQLPQPLYLRESLREELHEQGGFVWLAPRSGPARTLADRDDGAADRRVPWPEADRRATKGETIDFQVTLLERAPARGGAEGSGPPERARLVVAGTLWLEGETLELSADGALRGLPSSGGGNASGLTYHDVAAPERALGRIASPPLAPRPRESDDDPLFDVPPDFDGRALALDLATRASAGASDPLDQAARIAAWFRDHGQVDPGHALERWFDFFAAPAPRGRAEHFAQACALALRLADLPARVVVGYRAAVFDAEHRRWRVRAADRHAWVEVGFAEDVWIALDPTPDRTAPRPPAAERLAEEFGQRLTEATSLRSVQQSIEQARPWWIGLALLVAVAAFLAFPTVRLAVDPTGRGRPPDGLRGPARRAWRYWQELEEVCGRFDVAALPTQTATEFATRVNAAVPDESRALARLLNVYHSCRFGGAELAADDERQAKALLVRLPAALQRHREHARALRRNTR